MHSANFEDFKPIFQFDALETVENSNSKIVKMIRLNEALAVLIPILNLLVSNGMCDSHISHYESHDAQLHHGAIKHYPLQPELVRAFENCHKSSGTFDLCIKSALNELRVYYKSGK